MPFSVEIDRILYTKSNRKVVVASSLVRFLPYFCFRFGLQHPLGRRFRHVRCIFARKSSLPISLEQKREHSVLLLFTSLSKRKSASAEPEVICLLPNGYM